MLIELDPDEPVAEVHGLVHQVLAKGSPVVLCGTEGDITTVRQSLKTPLEGEGLLMKEIALHVPSRGKSDYRYRVLKLTVLHRLPFPVPVCFEPFRCGSATRLPFVCDHPGGSVNA